MPAPKIQLAECLQDEREQIAFKFNQKAKDGINEIRKICADNKIEDAEEQIAAFFLQEYKNLNLVEVGEYIGSSKNKIVLEKFTQFMDFNNQSFMQALRAFCSYFKLPGEAVPIGNIVEAFGKAYKAKNPESEIADSDAGYVLAYQAFMLNKDLHSPQIKTKMTTEQLAKNLKGVNKGKDFTPEFLQDFYNEILTKPFICEFAEMTPGVNLTSAKTAEDKVFKTLAAQLDSPKSVDVKSIFPFLPKDCHVHVQKPTSLLKRIFGVAGTLEITLANGGAATVELYKPSAFSFMAKLLGFGEQNRVVIQPLVKSGNENTSQESLNLVGKLAASFSGMQATVNATYDYEKEAIQQTCKTAKLLVPKNPPVIPGAAPEKKEDRVKMCQKPGPKPKPE